jgi:hypothetical protein
MTAAVSSHLHRGCTSFWIGITQDAFFSCQPTWNTLEFDGASRGNPGRGGAGAVFFDPDHDVVRACSRKQHRACILAMRRNASN